MEMNSNLEANMVAQLGTRTGAVLSGEGVQSAAAMDPLLPAALEMANTSVFELSLTRGRPLTFTGDQVSQARLKRQAREARRRRLRRKGPGIAARGPLGPPACRAAAHI